MVRPLHAGTRAEVADNERLVKIIFESGGTKPEGSMGAEFSGEDLGPVTDLASAVNSLIQMKEKNTEYITLLMQDACPNILAIAGALVGAN